MVAASALTAAAIVVVAVILRLTFLYYDES